MTHRAIPPSFILRFYSMVKDGRLGGWMDTCMGGEGGMMEMGGNPDGFFPLHFSTQFYSDR
jgi:hypothetical protein